MSSKRYRRFAVYGLLGFLVLAFVGFLANFLRPPLPIIVGKNTTVIESPLADDGLPDYPTVLQLRKPDGAHFDDNGAIPFWKAVGNGQGIMQNHVWKNLCDRLDIDPSERQSSLAAAEDDLHIVVSKWLKDTKSVRAVNPASFINLIYEAQKNPWTTDQCNPLADRINANRQRIDLLVRAGNSPAFWISSSVLNNSDDQFETMVERMSAGRQALPWLLARAQLRIGENKLELAWEDISAAYGLIDLICGKALLGYIYWAILKQQVDAAALDLLHAESIDDALFFQVAERLLGNPQTHFEAALYQERCFQAECIVTLYRHQMSGVTLADDDMIHSLQTSLLMKGSLDWNVCLREINNTFDEIGLAAFAIGDQAKRAKHLGLLKAKRQKAEIEISSLPSRTKGYFSREHRSQLVAYEVTRSVFDSYERFLDTFDQHAQRRAVIKLAIELANHFRKQGRYPNDLEDVYESKKVFQFALNRFGYRQLPNGYLLYSFGPNNRDDRGSTHGSTFRGIENWPDVVVLGQSRIEEVLTRHGETDVISNPPDYVYLIPHDADDISIRRSNADLSLGEKLIELSR